MPNYSSSKNAWPTFNLPNMGGGGVTRPMIRVTKTKESTHTDIGPTRKARAKLFDEAEANFWAAGEWGKRAIPRDKIKSGPFSPEWEESAEGKKYMQSSRGGIAEEKDYTAFFNKRDAELAKLNKVVVKKPYIPKTKTKKKR